MSRLGLSERTAIEAGIYQRLTFTEISKQINVSVKSISNEVRRNRSVSPAPRYNGKDCRRAPECEIRFVCGDTECRNECVRCRKFDCCEICPNYISPTCAIIKKPPYVCNVCKMRRSCKADRAYYVATHANTLAQKRYSASRSNPQTQGDDLKALDALLTPLIHKGQPLSHIITEHEEEIPVSERTLYRYIDSGMLSIKNIDLRRKVTYRARKKKKVLTESAKNSEFRKNRTYADFLEFTKKRPKANYVEMDTVIGCRGSGARMLTMLFVKQNLMLIFHMRDGKADSVVEIFDWLTSALGVETFRKLFPAILTDNGSEFKHTLELEKTIDGIRRTRIFYCDPQASWQKPHIEKNHEYIRYVLPKGKSFNSYTQEDFTLLANHINSIKRMQFGGKSPYEMATSDEFRELMFAMNLHSVPADDILLRARLFRR